MSAERKNRVEKGKQDSENHRGRSSSPSLFFSRSSSSNLLKLRRAHSPVKEARKSTQCSNNLDTQICTDECPSSQGTPKQPQVLQASSHNSKMMVEVLPSFELYNTLHRHIPQGNVNPDMMDFPPTYQAVQSQAPAFANESSEHVRDSSTTSLQSLNTVESRSGHQILTLEALGTMHEPIQDDLSESDNINIDKIYSLPKLKTPIEIDIHVTKDPAGVDKKAEDESILREYTSGDIIHGYVIIENRSPQPLKFEMFYVTLEGRATVIDREGGKRTVKRFLRMVDISASWSYSMIDVSNGLNYSPGARDFENCVMGLNNSRVLEPNTKYKKYFMFKLPMQLLDVSCKHQQFSHCLVPPTFGIDSTKDGGRYSGIKINPMLGYGHLGTKGSPILTTDLSSSEIAISYTIDTKVVGKDSRTKKLNILREREYNLRFVPFGFCRPFTGERDPLKQLQDIIRLVQERIRALKKVMHRLELGEQITSEDLHDTDVSGAVVDPTEVDSEDILRRKINQLYISNRIDPVCSSFPVSHAKFSKTSKKTIETEFKYALKDKHKSSKKLKKGFFGGLSGSTNGSTSSSTSVTNKSGIIVLSCDIPRAGLQYLEPSLLRKTNKLENKGVQNKENWENLINSLSSKDRDVLDQVTVNMRCIQASNCEPHEPPQIQSVTTELICMTLKSTNSIPMKLDADIVLKKERFAEIQSTFQEFKTEAENLQQKFNENRDRLNELFNKTRRPGVHEELRFTDFLSEQIITDIESIANLRSEVQTLPHIFKKQSHTLENEDDLLDCLPSKSPSKSPSTTSILSSTFSGSSSGTHHASTAERLRRQLFHEWIKSNNQEYDRAVTVNLEFGDDSKETLIPTFESCLISRLYCVRVNIKFEGQSHTATIDIPVQIRRLES
ncbi:LANO_0F14026g1_1 [Lachancea nothofagi CBS 11611]|uniref:LANO_0F14026g1_1 n=1 Tax=Lachancea nothofagi CBS 11611 TaxID=1266666 RepID=A0A1G4KC04_9SACH|nr:LANO_0F14026g1_1 [Lachancea nothofagi CBS 11611]